MKRKILLSLLLGLSLVLPVSFCSTGCSTNKQQQAQVVTYNSLRATAITVDVAMQAYAEFVVKGSVSTDTQVLVQNLHRKYRVTLKEAVALAKFDYSAATPANVAELAGSLVGLIKSILAEQP